MKTAFLTILTFVLSTLVSMASGFPEAVNAYVRELFFGDDFRDDFRERWRPVMWESYSSQRNDPNGGYVFRFTLSFSPDEKALAFVGTDRFGGGKPAMLAWNIYMRSEDGEWQKIAESKIINHERFYIDYDARTILQHWPDRFGEGKSFSLLRIGKDGSYEEEYYSSEDTPVEKQEEMGVRGEPFHPQIEKIPIAAYLLDPTLEWRPLSEHGMVAQSLDPADAPLLASGKDLEWSQAVDFAKTLIDNPSEPQRTHASSEPLPQPPAPGKPTEQKPAPTTTVEESPPFSPRWPVVAVVVVAALGLLWLWLKKRK